MVALRTRLLLFALAGREQQKKDPLSEANHSLRVVPSPQKLPVEAVE
jgi:hypothetical protein